MKKLTKRDKDRAEKKVDRAIDALVDIQDLGFGCYAVTQALDLLNSIRSRIPNAK